MEIKSKKLISLAVGMATAAFISPSYAQLEEIVVTATKRAGGADVQEVPVAITALGEEQIENMHLRDLKAVGFAAPNVQLEDIGTAKGTANFSIRGLGINSSIITIDPTVGTFIDGVYLGFNGGVVFDTFDLEGIEVLRGPQGILFGRNVTGGAVLLRTTLPGDEFKGKVKAAYESGNNIITSAVFSGPLTENLGGKIALYHNNDGGYFTNLFDGNDNFGETETTLARGNLVYEMDNWQFILRAEHGESEGDSPPSQNTALFEEGSFDFSVDDNAGYENEWNNVSLETNIDVAFGDGTITNILAYRDFEFAGSVDVDASPILLFSGPAASTQDQVSNELRYAGTFGSDGQAFVTTGLYYFTQEINTVERRILFFGLADFAGGGIQDSETYGMFANVDYDLNEQWTVTVGGRYTYEEKTALIATLPAGLCTLEGGCPTFDFPDPVLYPDSPGNESWNSFTPKIGVKFKPTDTSQIYAHWSKGFRSGGYNFRDTSPSIPGLTPITPPGPFDQEEQDAFEIGFKYDSPDNNFRLNGAIFHNTIDDQQREINLPGPAGVAQEILNVADTTIQGIELEAQWYVSENFRITAQYGYVDGEYDSVNEDISFNPNAPITPSNTLGVIDEADLALDIPRLVPESYGLGFRWDLDVGFGDLTVQADYSHRDAAAYTDNNAGQLLESDMVNANITLALMEGDLRISFFGKNITDEATIGGDTQLPSVVDGVTGPGQTSFAEALLGAGVTLRPGEAQTFSPLNKGRIWGADITYEF